MLLPIEGFQHGVHLRYSIERTNLYVANGPADFWILVIEGTKVFQRTADGVREFLFAQKNPETLHTSLLFGFHLDR